FLWLGSSRHSYRGRWRSYCRCKRCGSCRSAASQTIIFEIGPNVRIVPDKAPVHLGKVFGVAAREHHVAEALPVLSGQAAVAFEPVERVLRQHPRPGVGIITSGIAVAPDVEEIAGAVT